MPGRSGLDILKEIKIQKPKLSVLVLSIHPEEQIAVRALKSGASGYLTKSGAPDELIEAIRKVSSGGEYITSSLAERLAFHLRTDSDKPLHETLSDREYEVMCKIASGKTVKEIAKEMSLSPITIGTYRSRIMEKMMMKNNVELATYAIKHGLIE
jgi:DNA-binding NarL/FixJ family response regulator